MLNHKRHCTFFSDSASSGHVLKVATLYDNDTNAYTPIAATVYTGACRLWVVSGSMNGACSPGYPYIPRARANDKPDPQCYV